jgi:hypothetical protein
MPLSDLSISQLKRAVSIKETIEKLNKELRSILGGSGDSNRAANSSRRMSLASRRKIAAAQKARWAKLRRAKSPAGSAKPAAKKTVSPATRKKLAAKLKAYWAAKRRGK